MHTPTWAICCPSPLLNLQLKTIAARTYSHIIAVNGAIILDVLFAFTYWAVQDIEVFETLFDENPHFTHRAVMWVPRHWLEEIPRDYDRLSKAFASFTHHTFPGESVEAFAATMPFGRHINWREYTLFLAIAQAIKYGATHIHVYGAYWQGNGYCRKGLANSRTQHTDARWHNEQTNFQAIFAECQKHNIFLTRIMTVDHD